MSERFLAWHFTTKDLLMMAELRNNSSIHAFKTEQFPCDLVFREKYPAHLEAAYGVPLAAALVLITLCTIIFNATFLVVVSRALRLRTISNTLLISLSVTDLVTGIAVLPFIAASFILYLEQNFICIIFWHSKFSTFSVALIAFWHIPLISLEKYLAIMHPFWHQRCVSKNRIIMVVLLVWVTWIALPLASLLIGFSHPTTHRRLGQAIPYLCGIFYILVIYCYIRIFVEIRKVKRKISIENTVRNGTDSTHQNRNAAVTTLIVIGAYTLCCLPTISLYVLWTPINNMGASSKTKLLLELSSTVVFVLNPIINPLVYYARMTAVRKEFIKMLFSRNMDAY